MAICKYDSHVHFNHNTPNPYHDLKSKLKYSDISKCLLILNTEEDEKVFWDNIEEIENDHIVTAVAVLLEVNDVGLISSFEKYKSINITICVKLHPRISDITVKDFDSIVKAISAIDLKVIVVDCFIYGPQMNNHIGVELAVILAKKFPERSVIIAHAGGCDILKTMLITRPLSNVYYDYSLTCNYLENTSVRLDMVNGLRFFKKRIMYGTDYPDFQFLDSSRVIETLCEEAGLSQEETVDIFWGNACRIYGGDEIK